VIIRAVKRTARAVYPAKVDQPEWDRLLGDDFAEHRRIAASIPAGAPDVLLAPSVGHPAMTTLDSLLAVALTVRGARVHVLLCDEILPACQNCLLGKLQDEWVPNEFLRYGPKRELCRSCYSPAHRMFESLGVRVHSYGDFLEKGDIDQAWQLARSIEAEDIPHFTVEGLPIGEHATAGAIRFFARASLDREQHGEEVLRRYFAAALLTRFAISRLLQQHRFVSASFNHGIYVPQGIIGAVARQQGVRVVNWIQAYRKSSFIFSHDDTYHHTLMSEPVEAWQDVPWDEDIERELMDYLKSRWTGAEDWIHFNRGARDELAVISKETGIDFSKPSIGLLTNVMWDAQLHYPQNAFKDMWEWLVTTIRYFEKRPELQLIIRVHPAERRGHIQSRQPVAVEIAREFGQIPKNVFIIPPESDVSTYAVMLQCDSVLIYGTKTGVELTSLGVPVIVAGEAWIRNKGITLDARTREEYLTLLDALPLGERLSEDKMRRAKKYAYHFFFRRMIPLASVIPVAGKAWAPYAIKISGLKDVRPGADPGLDVICDGILHGNPFIFPAEHLRLAPRLACARSGQAC
jgi:hypothetical protein